MKYSPNHPTMRGREIPATLKERRAAVRVRVGTPPKKDRYKLKASLGFVSFFMAAGSVERLPMLSLVLLPAIVYCWLPFDRHYWEK